jgi:hypothetical protein
MRKFLILALLAGPVSAEGLTYPVLVARYEILEGHPKCSGPGKVAFRVEAAQQVTVEYYPAEPSNPDQSVAQSDTVTVVEEPEACYVKVRRGEVVEDKQVACPGVSEARLEQEARREVRLNAYCEAVDQIPDEASLELQLTACLTVGAFETLEGSWTLSNDSEAGSYSISGDIKDDDGHLKYLAETSMGPGNTSSVVFAGTETSPARLRLRAESPQSVVLQQFPDLELVVATEVDLNLLESSESECLQDPTKCLWLVEQGNEINMPRKVGEAYALTTRLDILPAPFAARFRFGCYRR